MKKSEFDELAINTTVYAVKEFGIANDHNTHKIITGMIFEDPAVELLYGKTETRTMITGFVFLMRMTH